VVPFLHPILPSLAIILEFPEFQKKKKRKEKREEVIQINKEKD
jgi:hypothetical protein